jgi:SAM-dependent methyltransferase
VSIRPDEQRIAREFDRWLGGRSLSGVLMRSLLGHAGPYLLNTPWVDLPDRFALRPRQRLLELGTGRGSLLSALHGRIGFARAPVGVDASRVLLRYAAHDRRGTAAPELIKYLSDETLFRVLHEALRVLEPGGLLLAWEFAPTSSRRLNALHQRLLTLGPTEVHLRGFGLLAPCALSAGFAHIERIRFRTPFLFPPIPRVVVACQKRSPVGEGAA